VCPFPIAIDKFDNDILSWHRLSPCAKSDAVGAIFHEANIFEFDVSTAVRTVSSN